MTDTSEVTLSNEPPGIDAATLRADWEASKHLQKNLKLMVSPSLSLQDTCAPSKSPKSNPQAHQLFNHNSHDPPTIITTIPATRITLPNTSFRALSPLTLPTPPNAQPRLSGPRGRKLELSPHSQASPASSEPPCFAAARRGQNKLVVPTSGVCRSAGKLAGCAARSLRSRR